MNCPGCQQQMEAVPLEGTYRGPMSIDVCTACRGFWFDAGEQFRADPRRDARPAAPRRSKPQYGAPPGRNAATLPAMPSSARPHLRSGGRRQVSVLPLPGSARHLHAVLRVPSQPETRSRTDAAGARRTETEDGFDQLPELRRTDRSADRDPVRKLWQQPRHGRSCISRGMRCGSSTPTPGPQPPQSARRQPHRPTRSSPTGGTSRKRVGDLKQDSTVRTLTGRRSICSMSAWRYSRDCSANSAETGIHVRRTFRGVSSSKYVV
jgi:Zn-finger nucleic acid-binding protein